MDGSKDVLSTNPSKSSIVKNSLKLQKDLAEVVLENPRCEIAPVTITKLRDACLNRKELAMAA